MNELHRTFRFANGHMLRAAPPGWFAGIAEGNEDWSKALRGAGATGIDEFSNRGESLEIYAGPEGDFFIAYRDAAKCVAKIFINNVADYLLFRANYVAPLANLIMETERHNEWLREQGQDGRLSLSPSQAGSDRPRSAESPS